MMQYSSLLTDESPKGITLPETNQAIHKNPADKFLFISRVLFQSFSICLFGGFRGLGRFGKAGFLT